MLESVADSSIAILSRKSENAQRCESTADSHDDHQIMDANFEVLMVIAQVDFTSSDSTLQMLSWHSDCEKCSIAAL
jgi:hypothetical protein